jgi:hypothetical protein
MKMKILALALFAATGLATAFYPTGQSSGSIIQSPRTGIGNIFPVNGKRSELIKH